MSEVSAQPGRFLPQLISQAFDQLMDDLHQHLVRAGHEVLRPTHCVNVLRLMDCDGTRPTVLARRAGMSPQAMSELIGYLEQHEYVRRIPDPTDGRGRIVIYADRGTEAAEIATAFFADIERRWSAVVGVDRLDDVTAAFVQILGASAVGAHPRGTVSPGAQHP